VAPWKVAVISVSLRPSGSPKATAWTPHSYSAPARAQGRWDHDLAPARVDASVAVNAGAEGSHSREELVADGKGAKQLKELNRGSGRHPLREHRLGGRSYGGFNGRIRDSVASPRSVALVVIGRPPSRFHGASATLSQRPSSDHRQPRRTGTPVAACGVRRTRAAIDVGPGPPGARSADERRTVES
jgi:hypothetical protein